jgi:hypothetical protein
MCLCSLIRFYKGEKFSSNATCSWKGCIFVQTLHVGWPEISKRPFPSEYLKVGYCIAMCNVTVALPNTAWAINFREEVIVPAYAV